MLLAQAAKAFCQNFKGFWLIKSHLYLPLNLSWFDHTPGGTSATHAAAQTAGDLTRLGGEGVQRQEGKTHVPGPLETKGENGEILNNVMSTLD